MRMARPSPRKKLQSARKALAGKSNAREGEKLKSPDRMTQATVRIIPTHKVTVARATKEIRRYSRIVASSAVRAATHFPCNGVIDFQK